MEDIQNHEILPGQTGEVEKAETDFDRAEPQALLITGLGIAALIGLIIVILGIQAYFDHITQEAVYQKVEVPVADDLKSIHIDEDGELNSYKYVDRATGVVQIPIGRAMQLIAEEAATKKLKYFQKTTPVKAINANGPAAPAPPATGAAGTPAPAK